VVDVPIDEVKEGTYELVGPKIQGNPYRFSLDTKVPVSVLKKGNPLQPNVLTY
jgi:hypothetical protein